MKINFEEINIYSKGQQVETIKIKKIFSTMLRPLDLLMRMTDIAYAASFFQVSLRSKINIKGLR